MPLYFVMYKKFSLSLKKTKKLVWVMVTTNFKMTTESVSAKMKAPGFV